jgi:hypothetical protein
MLAVSSIVFAWYIIANAKPNFSEDCSYTIDELENQFQSGGLGPKTTANVVSTLKYNCENDLSDASSTFIVGINEYVAASAEEMNEQASLVLYSFVNLCQNLQKEPGIDLSHNAKKLCGEAEEKSKDRYEEENYQTTMISDNFRVFNGGSWKDVAYWLAPGARRFMHQDSATNHIGFRCAMIAVGGKDY